eukprot:scaffold41448_cov67-Phaeocystis_antarctica.AAC.9
MGLKERCAQWFAFFEAKTACTQRHDCLRAGAEMGWQLYCGVVTSGVRALYRGERGVSCLVGEKGGVG